MLENEFITVTRIYTVDKYVNTDTTPKLLKYKSYFSLHELVFFLSGENETFVDDVKMHDRPGFLRYMPKGLSRSEYTVSTLSPSVCIDVFFDVSVPLSAHAFGMPDMGVLKDSFTRLYDVWNKKNSGYHSNAMMLLYDILYGMQKKKDTYLSSAQRNSVKKAHDYISAHFKDHAFDYGSLGKLCGLGHTQFGSTVKKVYSATPVQLVTQMRIEYAKELLATSHYTLTEIADMCGSENPYYFSTVFKKLTGVSPSRYKLE